MEDYVRDANELVGALQGRERRAVRHPERPERRGPVGGPPEPGERARAESADAGRPRARPRRARTSSRSAHRYFLESLELRRDGLPMVADQLPGALAQEERRSSTGRIAQMMQVFLASDVLLRSRYDPLLRDALEEEDIDDPEPAGQAALTFVDDLGLARPRLRRRPDRRHPRLAAAAPTPGLHGNGLGTVSLAGVALTPGGSATVQLSSDAAFDVQVVNQGESTETDVTVTVRWPGRRRARPRGDDPRDRRRRARSR